MKLGHILKKQCPCDILEEDSMRYHRLEWEIYQRLHPGGRTPAGIPRGRTPPPASCAARMPLSSLPRTPITPRIAKGRMAQSAECET